MDNYHNEEEYKKLLALICAQNQFTPSILDVDNIKQIFIKEKGAQEWIPITGKEEFEKYQDPKKIIDAKLNYLDHENNEKEKIIPNIKDIDWGIKINDLNILSNFDDFKYLFSTTDFMEMYLYELRRMYPDLDTHIKVLHDIAQEVGKPLVYVTRDVDIVDRSVPRSEQKYLELVDLEEGMSVHMEGKMYSPDMDQCPEKVDTRVLGYAHHDFDSYEITVVEGEDAIYVSYDQYPDLEMERTRERYEEPPRPKVPDEELLLEQWWLRKMAERNKPAPEIEIDGGEVYPLPPKWPGRIEDPIPEPQPGIIVDPPVPDIGIGKDYTIYCSAMKQLYFEKYVEAELEAPKLDLELGDDMFPSH